MNNYYARFDTHKYQLGRETDFNARGRETDFSARVNINLCQSH